MAKLSCALQTKHLDLSLISSLVDATLNSLDGAILPSANWVLQLQDASEDLKAATGIEVTHLDICSFQESVGKPFISLIKDNISSRFRSSSKDVLSAFSIFDPKKVPSLSTHELTLYGDSSIQTLIGQFRRDLPAKLLEETEFEKAAIVSSDLSTEWKTYCQLLISMQLKELLTSDMLIALIPNLHKLATICLSIPISIGTKFLRHEINMNRLRNRLTELSPSNLMKIVIESPPKLTDSDLEEIVDVWNRKGDGLLCKLSFRLLSHYICILSLLMHFIKHLSTSIMNFNNTISKGDKGSMGRI